MTPTPAGKKLIGHTAVIDLPLEHPWEVLPAFQFMREAAKAYGFCDVDKIEISLEVHFSTFDKEPNKEGLSKRLDDAWFCAGVQFKPDYKDTE
jgi:hypothetical protein